MGSKFQFNTASLDAQIDTILVASIRVLVVVFFLVVAIVSFVFAVTLTSVCLFAAGLHLMLRFVAHRPETQRLFALAGC